MVKGVFPPAAGVGQSRAGRGQAKTGQQDKAGRGHGILRQIKGACHLRLGEAGLPLAEWEGLPWGGPSDFGPSRVWKMAANGLAAVDFLIAAP